MSSQLRIGILGASRIAGDALVAPAVELGHRLVAVAARDRERAEAFAEKYGVERVLDGYEDVINDSEVDAVYNPLANSLHAPWNLVAIQAGKPVLTEKPFASNRAEAQRVHEAAVAAGVPVLEAFHYLFHPVTPRSSSWRPTAHWDAHDASRWRWRCRNRTPVTRGGPWTWPAAC